MRLPHGRPERQRPPVATPCDASPDLGFLGHWQSWVQAHSSPRRPRHATPTTSSHSTRDSLQLLPWPVRRVTGEPPGDTEGLLRRSGSPPNLHHGGKHDSGGRLRRRRNATPRHATQLGPDGRFGDAPPLERNLGPTRGTQRGNATHAGETRYRHARANHGFVRRRQLRRRTRGQNRTRRNATGRETGLHNALPFTVS